MTISGKAMRLFAFLLGLASLGAPMPAAAMGLSIDFGVPNFAAVGVGVTPEWMGSRDNAVGFAPAARMQFQGERFFELYGPIADVNLINSRNWEFGPMLSWRFGRKDVDDPVVNRLPSIDGGIEAGAFFGYHLINTSGTPWRLRLGVAALTGVSGGANGTNVTPYGSFWMPVSPSVFLGIGGGLTWSSDAFMRQRFGVDPFASALSGLPAYSAGSGVRQYYVWPAVIVRLAPQWLAGGGAFYQRITGDAADSPIVTQRGDRNQWTVGGGVGYTWK